jgi:hypothetical protein
MIAATTVEDSRQVEQRLPQNHARLDMTVKTTDTGLSAKVAIAKNKNKGGTAMLIQIGQKVPRETLS